MRKTFFLFFLAFCASLFAQNVQDGALSIPEGTWRISFKEYTKRTDIVTLTIPSSVQLIDGNAFSNCTKLQTVYFNATNCNRAGSLFAPVFFKCKSLHEVHFAENVEYIPDGIFTGVKTLSSVALPAGVKVVGGSAFSTTSLSSIELPEGLKIIGPFAFSNTRIMRVTIPMTVDSIGPGAFPSNCRVTCCEGSYAVTYCQANGLAYTTTPCASATSASAAETTPAAETAPAVETAPAAETTPAAETAPAVETAPAAETVPATETAPAVETTPAAEIAPAAETTEFEFDEPYIMGQAFVELAGYAWATRNVGATFETDYGTYYDFNGAVFDAGWWGKPWTLPTKEHFQALIDQCNWERVRIEDEIMIFKVSDKNDPSKFIYLPIAGFEDNTGVSGENVSALYWTGSAHVARESACLYVYNHYDFSPSIELKNRSMRFPVRLVSPLVAPSDYSERLRPRLTEGAAIWDEEDSKRNHYVLRLCDHDSPYIEYVVALDLHGCSKTSLTGTYTSENGTLQIGKRTWVDIKFPGDPTIVSGSVTINPSGYRVWITEIKEEGDVPHSETYYDINGTLLLSTGQTLRLELKNIPIYAVGDDRYVLEPQMELTPLSSLPF